MQKVKNEVFSAMCDSTNQNTYIKDFKFVHLPRVWSVRAMVFTPEAVACILSDAILTLLQTCQSLLDRPIFLIS